MKESLRQSIRVRDDYRCSYCGVSETYVGSELFDFMGTSATNVATAKWGRNSIGVEVDPTYFDLANQCFCREMTVGEFEAYGGVLDRTELLADIPVVVSGAWLERRQS